jgi:hypothetical protein
MPEPANGVPDAFPPVRHRQLPLPHGDGPGSPWSACHLLPGKTFENSRSRNVDVSARTCLLTLLRRLGWGLLLTALLPPHDGPNDDGSGDDDRKHWAHSPM